QTPRERDSRHGICGSRRQGQLPPAKGRLMGRGMIVKASALVLVASACSSTRAPCEKAPSLGGESAREEVPSSKLRLSIHSVEPAKGHRIDLEVKIQNVSKEFLWIPHGLSFGPLN